MKKKNKRVKARELIWRSVLPFEIISSFEMKNDYVHVNRRLMLQIRPAARERGVSIDVEVVCKEARWGLKGAFGDA